MILKELIEVAPPVVQEEPKSPELIIIKKKKHAPKIKQNQVFTVVTPEPAKPTSSIELVEIDRPNTIKSFYEVPPPADILPPPDNVTVKRLTMVKPTQPVSTDDYNDVPRNDEVSVYSRRRERPFNDNKKAYYYQSDNQPIGRLSGRLTQLNPARKSLWPWLITIPLGFLFLEGLSLILFQIRKKQFVFF